MRSEININNEVKLVMTKDEFGYSEVLDTMNEAKFVRVVTYNISKESENLINILEDFTDDKDVIIITNIPNRFKRYTSSYAKGRAKQSINNYIEKLNPDNYDANIRTFFNFGNHSKIIMTDKMAYIGSANFSDESKCNNECGIIIKDSRIIKEINDVFIKMQIEESVEYYCSTYMKVFVMIANIVSKAEMYYEEYYWSFFQDSGHQHHGRGDEYRGFDASLSPTLVEDIVGLSYEIEEALKYLNDEEIYIDIFEELDVSICEQIRNYFDIDSELEIFSRFDVEQETHNIFQEYLELGNPDYTDDYAQSAIDDAGEIQMNLIDGIYQTSLDGMEILNDLKVFVIDLLNKVEERKEINEAIDNT